MAHFVSQDGRKRVLVSVYELNDSVEQEHGPVREHECIGNVCVDIIELWSAKKVSECDEIWRSFKRTRNLRCFTAGFLFSLFLSRRRIKFTFG